MLTHMIKGLFEQEFEDFIMQQVFNIHNIPHHNRSNVELNIND